ncbi:MAG: endonuclease III [Thermoplasmatales archaeon]|nr:MAG: endonuclease III [Thermoplasmatales archaeon]
MKKIKNLDKIFKLLKEELNNFNRPVISQEKWNEVVKSPFTTLISCILSLRTKDEVTDKASIRLLKDYDTPQKIINVSEEEIKSLIYPVGFYKTKSKRIRDISKILIEKYSGKVPDTFDELLKLKGVGRKTANIVMVYGHKKQGYIPIDTHCHRIPNRLGWVNTKKPEQTEKELKKVLPKKYWNDFNHIFVIFGQKICTPVSPFCSRCPIKKYCEQIYVTKSR